MSDRLYRTAAGDIVAEDHPDAAFLVVSDNGDVPDEYADAVKAYRKGAPVARHTSKAKPAAASEKATDYAALTKAELYDLATEADIEGRSTMTKDELVEALGG